MDTQTVVGRRDLAILDTMLYCGLRPEEIAGLNLADLKPAPGRWTLSLEGRTLAVPRPLQTSLSAWWNAVGRTPGEAGPLFVSTWARNRLSQRRMTSSAVGELVARYGHQAGLSREDRRLTPLRSAPDLCSSSLRRRGQPDRPSTGAGPRLAAPDGAVYRLGAG